MVQRHLSRVIVLAFLPLQAQKNGESQRCVRDNEGTIFQYNLQEITRRGKVLQQGEDVVHTRLSRDGALGIVVTGGIILRLRDRNCLHLHVVNDENEPLATRIPKIAHWSRMPQHHAEFAGEFALGITHERNHGALDLQISCPGLHHGPVIDAIDNHLVNILGLQLVLAL